MTPNRWLLALALSCAAAAAPAQALRLPFDGRWFVAQGGDTINVNHHMAVKAQWYGVDFAKLGGPSGRALSTPEPTRVEDFFCWGAPVLSPADGEVVAVENTQPDNPLGSKDEAHPAGNHVVIRQAPDRFVFLAHFQQGSIGVATGEPVRRGQTLGRCGNSGYSDFPHVHLHVQDRPTFGAGQGLNPIFSGMDVVLNGKRFDNVTWPVIRGLFVSPR